MTVRAGRDNSHRVREQANGSADDIRSAVHYARERLADWSGCDPGTRAAHFLSLRSLMAQAADELAGAVTRDIGKPLQEALGADLLPALSALQWIARAAPGHLRVRRLTRTAKLIPEPIGVVGVIGTWNYPIYLNLTTIAWALAAGNTVVWKPSELAEETAARLAALFERLGLPVVTVLGGPDVGRALCESVCDKVAFTGGVKTGRQILAALARHGTPSVMELSGRDAMIVCEDADLAGAARCAVWGRCSNAGQSCVAPQRIFVVRKQVDAFLREASTVVRSLRLGTDYNAMRTPELATRARQIVAEAVSQGARIVEVNDTARPGKVECDPPIAEPHGNCVPNLTAPHQCRSRSNARIFPVPGSYPQVPVNLDATMPATILTDCEPRMSVMREDFFGPVLAVCPVQDEEEGIMRANDSDMALGASIWTRDLARGRSLATRIRAGHVTINEVLVDAADAALPFGGTGASGFGKQRGLAGLEEFIHWKVVIAHSAGRTRRHLFPYRPESVAILRAMVMWHGARGAAERWRAIRALVRSALRWPGTDHEEGERARVDAPNPGGARKSPDRTGR